MLPEKSLKFVKYFIALFFISVFLLIFSFFGFLSPAEGLFGGITSPVVSFFSGISNGFKDIGKSIGELGGLQKENKDLKSEIKALNLEISNLKELRIENESLKKQLGFTEASNLDTVAGRIIAKEPSGFLRMVVINRGSKDGVKKDLAVIADGFLIGKVYEVNSKTSKVILLTDSNFQINAMVQESQALGLVKGQIGSGAVMENITKEKPVKIGDSVVTSNLENNIPEGLPIGKIQEVNAENDGLFFKASLNPFSNIDDARYVVVILGTE